MADKERADKERKGFDFFIAEARQQVVKAAQPKTREKIEEGNKGILENLLDYWGRVFKGTDRVGYDAERDELYREGDYDPYKDRSGDNSPDAKGKRRSGKKPLTFGQKGAIVQRNFTSPGVVDIKWPKRDDDPKRRGNQTRQLLSYGVGIEMELTCGCILRVTKKGEEWSDCGRDYCQRKQHEQGNLNL